MDQADELDNKTNNNLTWLNLNSDSPVDLYLALLRGIANNSAGQLNNDPTSLLKKLDDSEKGPALRKKLVEAWNEKKYQSIRDIDYLRKPLSPAQLRASMTLDQAAAIEKAWNVNYVGEAAQALLLHIKDFLPNTPLGDMEEHGRTLYARYTMIVQSSGMGKSRTVDEMGNSVLVVPMVLRSEGSTGYPPADLNVRAYLTISGPEMYQRGLAFLHALFDEVTSLANGKSDSALKGLGLPPLDRLKPFAAQFRAYMNHNMSMGGHGKFRVRFYDRVVRNAQRKEEKYISIVPDPTSSDAGAKILNLACEQLIQALTKNFAWPDEDPPFVVLSFDEADSLNDNDFIDLRRALRLLLQHRVFTLFLSTSAHMYQFIPNPTMDRSSRMVHEGRVVPPFSELGFDHFALQGGRDAMNVDEVLSHVSSTAELVKLGRPIWATRYNTGDPTLKAEIITFAASKLLGGCTPSRKTRLDSPHGLACLAQRLPIEFLSSSYSSSLADPQTTQIRSHLRVVLRIVHNLETMITVSPSEPILSEAAYWLMSNSLFKPAASLKNILSGFSVNSGDRGELLVMLLLTIARDRTVGLPDDLGVPPNGDRTCSLKNFLSNLFVEDHWNAAVGDKPSMEELFRDSKLFFNHFIKVHQFKMLNIRYILPLMARGAAMLCANSQQGIDLLIPFILKDDALVEGNIGLILVQVKNDDHYTADPKVERLERMSITQLSGIPTLCLFFALAAKQSCISRVDTPSQDPKTFNFWIAGLSSKSLLPVKAEGDDTWHALLDASYGWKETYIEHGRDSQEKEKRDRITNLRRSMNPGCATDDAHWKSWRGME